MLDGSVVADGMRRGGQHTSHFLGVPMAGLNAIGGGVAADDVQVDAEGGDPFDEGLAGDRTLHPLGGDHDGDRRCGWGDVWAAA